MDKRCVALLMAIIMLICLMPAGTAAAASPNVQVTLPGFKVNLNGTAIDNSMSQYPLIVYKDITYFPMTYYDCRFLGLESSWQSNTGLAIFKTGVKWDYHQYKSSTKNHNYYSAQVASFKVTVNGKEIDNRSEEYPLLIFRNVTYFPLTWRFAVDEFGWKYSFDQNNGLAIYSGGGTAAGQITLPIVTRDNGSKGAFTMAGDYFYYEGQNGKIYQSPVSDPAALKEVYQLPSEFMWMGIPASLYTDEGRAILKYHTGGVTMGTDHLIWLREDGTAQELDHGYSAFKMYDEYTVRVDHWAPPIADNLQIKKPGETEYTNVGDPECYFGRFFLDYGQGLSSQPSQDLYLIGHDIFVLGYYRDESLPNTTGIYRVNINTNETVRVCDEEAANFKIVNEMIYFTDRDHRLYQVPLNGGEAQLLADQGVGVYEALQGKVYYSLSDSRGLLTVGSDNIINPGGKVKSLEVQNDYLIAIFAKESESPYKMMVINNEGKVLYKTIEDVLLVRIENGKIVFVKDN
ncbi:MAG: DUF5050 domain-containing protein [Syntrophomonas sp.]|nr:DUF5050 domain-containing protein [Syntrophomonas sp.]